VIRNIMMATLYVQDHVVHFYHLHALDWVDIVNALKADPRRLPSWPDHSPSGQEHARVFHRCADQD